MIHTDQTLADVATSHPAATRVFLRHRLDFCCRGRRKLQDACEAAGLDPDQVVAEITAAAAAPNAPSRRWDTAPLSDLIDFILSEYHRPLRDELPALIEAARKVERVHAAKPSCPHGLAAHLELMQAEILQHMAKEEQVLFPAIRSGQRGAQLHMPVRVMMQEHDDHGVNLQRLRQLATDFRPPSEACATWRGLYAALDQVESELMEHIHLENHVLFPRAMNE